MFSNVYNVSGSHSYQQVTLCTTFQQKVFNLIEGGEIFAGSSQFLDFPLQILGGDSNGVFLSCCVNISKHHMVSQSKRLGKLGQKGFGTGVGMRLENTPDFLVWIILCSMECGLNFCGMMSIIIYNGDTGYFSLVLEAAFCSGKAGVPGQWLPERWRHCGYREPSDKSFRPFCHPSER